MSQQQNPSNAPTFDIKWLENAMMEVLCSASTVVTVQSVDFQRERQLEAYLVALFAQQVFRFHPWKGLERYDVRQQNFVPVSAPVDSNYGAGLQNDLKDLQGALRYMDGELKRERTALILSGLDQPEGNAVKNLDALNAVRSWAQDGGILAKKSVICWLTSQPVLAMDEVTLGMSVLARPELASDEDRKEIISKFVQKSGVRLPEQELNALTLATAGLTLHQTEVVIYKAFRTAKASRRDGIDLDTVKKFKADFIRRSDMLEIEDPSIDFADVGGYEGVKEMVQRNLVRALQHRERAERAALPLPRGILIYGPPGTGKTLFAKALAKETNLPFINLKTENLFSKYLGESGQRVRDAIHMVEQASPAIVFVDEIDRFGNRKSGNGDSASQETSRVFAQMLEWLGDANRKSIIVGTTNVPEDLDPAFLRPGRFSYVIPFLYPNLEARKQILEMHLGFTGSRRKPVMEEAALRAVVPQIAAETEFYAGADLEELVIRAKQNFFDDSVERMTVAHLQAAHKDYRINTSDRRGLADRYKSLGAMFANSVTLLQELEKQ
ncbi:MAG: ATP-binding protein [Verrucomicrobia bacterium]|nr:ATP-binding protein [Verrucomicrobiota bacterium]OQC25740.1 MAG: ATP-dependent zinc metalloprotease FtsH [Verrucomicrobia bacterium ADurb.Bin063]HOX63867.1 ATP-binding protein [Verrucomicrobiota bacterium]HPW91788.1 ATP-binding protein [Verrucomicrobiota bacterium]HQB72501.1 ATP-binding protein [Verrucomicrobiota bacterium]